MLSLLEQQGSLSARCFATHANSESKAVRARPLEAICGHPTARNRLRASFGTNSASTPVASSSWCCCIPCSIGTLPSKIFWRSLGLLPLSKLNLEQATLDRGGTAEPPQQACQSEHEFSFNSGLRVVVGCYGPFERRVVFGFLKPIDHSLCDQPSADRPRFAERRSSCLWPRN